MYDLEQRKIELQKALAQVEADIVEQRRVERDKKHQWIIDNVDSLLTLVSHTREDCVESDKLHEIKNPTHCGRCALLYARKNGYMYREFDIKIEFTFERY